MIEPTGIFIMVVMSAWSFIGEIASVAACVAIAAASIKYLLTKRG